MTRYEFAAAWARVIKKIGLPGRTPANAITDVPAGHWARSAVDQLISAGVLPVSTFSDVEPMHWAAAAVAKLDGAGQPRLVFRGAAVLLRRQFAEAMRRTWALAIRLPPGGSRMDASRSLMECGVLIGYPDGVLRLDRPATRGEFAWAASRFLNQCSRPR